MKKVTNTLLIVVGGILLIGLGITGGGLVTQAFKIEVPERVGTTIENTKPNIDTIHYPAINPHDLDMCDNY